MKHGTARNTECEALRNADCRLAVVVSDYHQDVTQALLDAAWSTLSQQGMTRERFDVYRVPGAWEIPLACSWVLELNQHVGLLALGAVIRGETSHDQHINRFVSGALGQLSLDSGVPIAFGLLTCDSLDQAQARSGGAVGNKGQEAALALMDMLTLRRQLDSLACK